MDTTFNLQQLSIGAFSIGGWSILLLVARNSKEHLSRKGLTNVRSESVEMVDKSHSVIKRGIRKFQITSCYSAKIRLPLSLLYTS